MASNVALYSKACSVVVIGGFKLGYHKIALS